MEKDSRFQPNKQTILKGGTLIYSTSVLHSASFPVFCNEEKTYVGTEMAVAILLSRLAVAQLIVLKQLDEAIASLMAQLKYGQAEWVPLYARSSYSKISSKKNVLLIYCVALSLSFSNSICSSYDILCYSFSFFQRYLHKLSFQKKKKKNKIYRLFQDAEHFSLWWKLGTW